MKPLLVFSCALASLLLISTGCQSGSTVAKPDDGRVTVAFNNPEKFTDFRDGLMGTERGREEYEDILRNTIQDEAARYLKNGDKLSVTFTDIDLAGDYLPSMHTGHDIRVIKTIYPPRMDLKFTLTDSAGTVLKEGERHLSDLAFMDRIAGPDRNSALYWDKELLRDWLKNELKSTGGR